MKEMAQWFTFGDCRLQFFYCRPQTR